MKIGYELISELLCIICFFVFKEREQPNDGNLTYPNNCLF